MPVPFDDLTADGNVSGGVAWFRLVEEEGGGGIRAALFRTSAEGEPLEFCFTRVDRRDQPTGRNGSAAPSALSSLARSLFRAVDSPPALVLALADETPEGAFARDIRVRLPFCRIGTAGTPVHGESEFLWAAEEPGPDSEAGRLLGELMARGSPFEPFDRVGKALTEAFGDGRVEALTAVRGLSTVVSLSPPPERSERTAVPGPAAPEAVPTAGQREEPPSPALARRLWALLTAPAKRSGQPTAAELEWPGGLMPFQLDGVRALLDNDRLLLADDMGLGKTVQAVAAMRILRTQRKIESCLVVAPSSLLDQWRREIRKWAPELSAIIVRGSAADRSWQWAAEVDVTLVSYDTLRSDFGGNELAPVRRKTWDVVVADEAQRIKNRNDTSIALKDLRRVRSWALTGTPIENQEEELASILEFVDHDRDGAPKRYHPGVELRERHRELQLRRRKGDVLDDLPPKQITMTPIDLHPSQRRSYDRAEQEGIVYLKSLGAEVTVQHVFALITRLKQICNADPQTGESSKLDDITERVAQLAAQVHKALVFSQYVDETSGVAAAVKRLHEFSPLYVTGGMPPEERQSVIDRFKSRDEHRVLALSLRAGGLGLNLQEASYVFHLDRWWNPAVERQAEDRSHRIGQEIKVNVIKYSCAGTIEERIDRILERKQGLFDQLIDDVSLDLSASLSRDELFGLFGLG